VAVSEVTVSEAAVSDAGAVDASAVIVSEYTAESARAVSCVDAASGNVVSADVPTSAADASEGVFPFGMQPSSPLASEAASTETIHVPDGWEFVCGVLVPPAIRPSSSKLSVPNALCAFTAPERLRVAQGNGYRCNACQASAEGPAAAHGADGAPLPKPSVVRDATRRLLFHSPPPVLTLHLKVSHSAVRFPVCGSRLRTSL
jgi:hypothetical protein